MAVEKDRGLQYNNSFYNDWRRILWPGNVEVRNCIDFAVFLTI